MPRVGKKKYAYTPKGRAAAKKAAKSTANTRTPQTARQRSVVAKRKIASQVRSAPGGRTRPKAPNTATKIAKALVTMLAPMTVGAPGLIGAVGAELKKATTPKPKSKPRNGSPVTPPAAKALERSRPKPAAAKPKQTTVHLGAIPPRRKPKRKAPTYRG